MPTWAVFGLVPFTSMLGTCLEESRSVSPGTLHVRRLKPSPGKCDPLGSHSLTSDLPWRPQLSRSDLAIAVLGAALAGQASSLDKDGQIWSSSPGWADLPVSLEHLSNM